MAQAEEIDKNLNLRLPEHLSRGHARVEIRTGLDYSPGESAESEFGVLLQPRVDAHTKSYGNVFAIATTTGGVIGGDASADPMLGSQSLTGLKQLYGGWSSGSLFGALGEDALTISLGRESVEDGGGILSWFAGAEDCDTGCWLQRRSTGFRSVSASLTAGPIQQRIFYATSVEANESPSFAGTRTTLTRSALEVSAGFAASVEENAPAVGEDPILSRLSASYKLGELLPWSPVLSSGYGFALGLPDDGQVHFTDAEDPAAYAWGARTVELGVSIEPIETMTFKAGYSSALSEAWLHGVDASAEWRPLGGLALRLQGRVSEAGSDIQPEDVEREASVNGSLDMSF